ARASRRARGRRLRASHAQSRRRHRDRGAGSHRRGDRRRQRLRGAEPAAAHRRRRPARLAWARRAPGDGAGGAAAAHHEGLVVGGGVGYWDRASASLTALADRSGIPVVTNGAGRGTLATDHPRAVSSARGFALGQADVVLVLGAPLDFRLGYGRPPTFAEDVKVAMIDADPSELGRNRALALGAVGDIDVVLRQLLDALPKGIAERLRSW